MNSRKSKTTPFQGATLSEILSYLGRLLGPENYHDSALNGLQVEAGNPQVARIAFAVDCGVSIIKKAIAAKADLLIVHHGLFWGGQAAPVGVFGEKIRLLINNGISLYGSHLPLDGNLKVGNAAELARSLGLTGITPHFQYSGHPIGVSASLPRACSLNRLQQLCQSFAKDYKVSALPFGTDKIRTVGIVTGSGSQFIGEAAKAGLDLLVTGEPKQAAYHEAKEMCQNVLFAGHYATETFGVLALKRELEKQFKISACFIDEPTGI